MGLKVGGVENLLDGREVRQVLVHLPNQTLGLTHLVMIFELLLMDDLFPRYLWMTKFSRYSGITSQFLWH